MTKKSKTILKAASLQRNVSKRLKIAKHKKSTVQVPPTIPAASSSSSSSTAITTKEPMQKKHNPWYNHFTKNDLLYNQYMANEWGVEEKYDDDQKNDNVLFEKLCLESAQSGLSWRTILYKRQAYRDVFHNFDIAKVSQMTSIDIDNIMSFEGSSTSKTNANDDTTKNQVVVKHRAKLESVVHNAKQVIAMTSQEGATCSDDTTNTSTFSNYLWSFVNHHPILNHWSCIQDIPSKSKESEEMSSALKKFHGFKFIGPTTCYSFMQSCGFVIDHPVNTPEWESSLARLKTRKGGFQNRGNTT